MSFKLLFLSDTDKDIFFNASWDKSKPKISELGQEDKIENICLPVPHPKSKIVSLFFGKICFNIHSSILYLEKLSWTSILLDTLFALVLYEIIFQL